MCCIFFLQLYCTTKRIEAHLFLPHTHNIIHSYAEENPLNFFTLWILSFNKAGFHNKVLMVGIELSSPPPLKPSHCASPPLHNSPFVRAGQQPTCHLLLHNAGPFRLVRWLHLCDSEQLGQPGPIRGQSPQLPPHFRVFPLTFTTPPNTHSAEKRRG